MDESVLPEQAGVDGLPDDPLDVGLAIAFGFDSEPPLPAGASVLKVLRSRMPELPSVHLREPKEDQLAPVIRPGSGEMPQANLPEGTVGRYQLLGEIARGGMGAILKGRDVDLGRDIAVKVLLEAHRNRTEFAQRFVEEAQIAGQLQHPGIIPIYEIGLFPDNRPYFTMKLINGQTLAALLDARKGLAEDRSRFLGIVLQVCQTLAYAHARGVIHRDLKPSNVMVGSFGEVQVMDWGLAKVLRGGGIADEATARRQHRHMEQGTSSSDAETGAEPEDGSFNLHPSSVPYTQAGSVMGTPAYMAPEQARGTVELVDERADVFGLGAILCEVLTGQPPFSGKGLEVQRKARAAQVEEAYSRLDESGAAAELIALAKQCLAPEPWDRPRHAGQVAEALTEYERSAAQRLRQAELDRATAEAKADSQQKRRHATQALGAVVLVLALAGSGALAWWWQQRAALAGERSLRANEAEKALADAAKDEAAGRWADARTTLAQATGRLGDSGPPWLLERVREARADAAMVADLEEIRLHLSEGSRNFNENTELADRLYAAAFEKRGISLTAIEIGEAVTRVRRSPIRDTQLAFLHDWLYWAPSSDRDNVRALLNGADDNEWRRAYRQALAAKDKLKLRELADDPKALAQPPVVICNLVDALSRVYSSATGLKLLREAQRLQPGDFWINYLLGMLLLKTEPEEALGFARAAVALRPSSGQAHALLGKAFLTMDDTQNAILAFHGAIMRDPDPPLVGVELVPILSSKGRRAEAPAVWEAILSVNPQAHKAWFGYAEFCLFLGKEDAYRRGCEALLERFGDTTEPLVAERVSRACLLAPASDDQIHRAAALADRAAATGPEWLRPYYLFAQGLAAYRQNRAQDAIPLLEESAATIPYPTARLVLAMARFRSGSREDARKGLQAAVRASIWNGKNADWVDFWVAQVLRREAEALILPGEKSSLQK